MNKAKEISALWSQIKPQIGEMVRLCHKVEDHAEVTADAYQRGYETAKHECEDCRKIRADAEQELADKAYQRGYENGFVAGHLKAEKSGQSFYEDGYKRGLNDAWECARKIRGMTWDEQREVFGTDYFTDIIALPASECIEKIRQYEQEKEEQIQVGDEVFYGNTKGIVIRPEDSDRYASVFTAFGEHISAENKDLTKTGRHFPEIAEVLAKMKETDNG